MTKPELIRFQGVTRRPDSNIYQFALRVPKDVRQHFDGPWAVRCSLGTAELRQANDKARALQAEWAARFEALRAGKPAPVDLAGLRTRLVYLPNSHLVGYKHRVTSVITLAIDDPGPYEDTEVTDEEFTRLRVAQSSC